MSNKLLLKKYSNRRLYDTERSVYVTLDDVSQAIRQGRNVEVVDAASGEDMTAFILTQIIMEESRKKNSLMPVNLLHLIIQYGENILGEFFEKYLEQTIKNYLSYKTMTDEQFRQWLNLGMDLSSLTTQSVTSLPAFRPLFDLFHEPDQPSPEDEKSSK